MSHDTSHSPAPWRFSIANGNCCPTQTEKKEKTLPKQEWGVVQVLLLYFHHVSTESVGSGRRATSTGDSDLFAMQTFFVFFQSAKKHVKGAKATTTNVSATTATVKRVTHCAACSSCCCCCCQC